MKLKYRIALFVLGLSLVIYGWGLLNQGIFAYVASRYRYTLYSPGTVAVGIFIALLAVLPSSKWLYPKITSRKRHKSN
jgi:Na+/H+ antiporter NhaD/arsenite permease-like protein